MSSLWSQLLKFARCLLKKVKIIDTLSGETHFQVYRGTFINSYMIHARLYFVFYPLILTLWRDSKDPFTTIGTSLTYRGEGNWNASCQNQWETNGAPTRDPFFVMYAATRWLWRIKYFVTMGNHSTKKKNQIKRKTLLLLELHLTCNRRQVESSYKIIDYIID